MSRDELSRLNFGPEPGQQLGGLGSIRYYARCSSNAENVLLRVKEVLNSLLQHGPVQNVDDPNWLKVVPDWFVRSCAPETTREEAEAVMKRLRLLSEEDRNRFNRQRKWEFKSWLYWFLPENRYWFWWDARVENENTIQIAVEVREWPFPWDALRWLFIASGASDLEAEI